MVQRMEFQGLLFFFEGSYPSIFFFLTCFHGSHVFIGVVLLSYQFFTIKKRSQLISQRFTGFLCSAWYWHFVDFVWIIVLTLIYVWPYM
jgi:heme/copper-type cytochrome/quinol oxidase subunit 3